jgi:uncharacterized protein (DUF1330 family)
MRILTTSLCFVAISTGSFAQQRPAYLIAEYEVLDAASMKKFGEASNPIVKAHGGQFVARRSSITPVIGDAPKSVTVIMFESVEKAKGYFQSAEYKAILPLRDAGAKFRSYIVESGDMSQ